MSQGFKDAPASQKIRVSRPLLLERDESQRSSFSGTAFPALDTPEAGDPAPVDGQLCYRTDLKQLYLRRDGAWVVIAPGVSALEDWWYASLAAADAAAVAAGKALRITQTHTVDADTTLSADLIFDGGRLNPPTTRTYTLRGRVLQAPLTQIFGGAGAVVGLRFVFPDWFGAVGDSNGSTGTDDSSAFNKAFACLAGAYASRGGRPTLELAAKAYHVTAASIEAYPQFGLGLLIKGQGTGDRGSRIYSDVTGPALWLKPTDDAPPTTITDFELRDLCIANGGSGTIGLRIGSDAAADIIDGVKPSLVENVSIEGFATDGELVNVRQIEWRRCAFRNVSNDGVGLRLKASGNGAFCGDMHFRGCEFVATDGTGARNVEFSLSGNSATGVAGLRYHGCIFYKGEACIYGRPSVGTLGDIWFGDYCQFDGQGTTCFDIRPSGTAICEAFRIADCYFNLYDDNLWDFRKSGSAILRDIDIHHNRVRNVWGALGYFIGGSRIKCSHNSSWEGGFNSGTPVSAAFRFEDCTQIECCFNDGDDDTSDGYNHIVLLTGACDRWRVVGNDWNGKTVISAFTDAAVSGSPTDVWAASNFG